MEIDEVRAKTSKSSEKLDLARELAKEAERLNRFQGVPGAQRAA
jgi:hypothetical protein